MATYGVLGSDVALTRFIGAASTLPLEVADSWEGLDLVVAPGGRGRRVPDASVDDLDVVAGRANLSQALVVRLLTPLGALAPLGHPEYGCRLGELVGRPNDEATRNLARLYTLRALAAEPRVSQVADLSLSVPPGHPDQVRISFAVVPVNDDQPLALALDVVL